MVIKKKSSDDVTVIGSATAISGNLEGNEDLTVFGSIEGSINLSRLLTVEASGVVRAEVKVREAMILGVLEGNIEAEELVYIAEKGRMIGDIKAPRVILIDGGLFKGQIDMGRGGAEDE